MPDPYDPVPCGPRSEPSQGGQAKANRKAPQGSPQGSLGNFVFHIFLKMFKVFWGFGSNIQVFCEKMFFELLQQNHAESFRNVVKNSVLNPRHTKLDQKS